jgi:putative ABC transport system permease protein
MQAFLLDAREAVRSITRRPGLAVFVVLTLAFPIGGNVVLFSAIEAVWLRPLAYPAQDRLVAVFERRPSEPTGRAALAPADVADLSERRDVFDGLGAYYTAMVTVSGGDHPERAEAAVVSPALLDLLGARPAAGRRFASTDAALPVAIVSEAFWRSRFGSARLEDQRLTIDGVGVTIAGVLVGDFDFPRERRFGGRCRSRLKR